MEIEEFKIIFEKSSHRSTIDLPVDPKAILQRGSISVMHKVQRNLNWEIAFASGFSLASLGMIFNSESIPVMIFLALLSVYSFAFSFYLLKLKTRLSKHISSLKSVRDHVTDSIYIIDRFMKLYKGLATGFIPCIFLAAFLAGLAAFLLENEGPGQIPYLAIAVSLPFVFGWIFLMNKLTSWYLNRLYGDHLQDLRLQQLELSE